MAGFNKKSRYNRVIITAEVVIIKFHCSSHPTSLHSSIPVTTETKELSYPFSTKQSAKTFNITKVNLKIRNKQWNVLP